MSQATSSNQPNLMPPIIYTSERLFDPSRRGTVTQQPTDSNVQVIYSNFRLGPDPMLITCPSCGKNVTTKVDYIAGTKTHTCSLLLCAMGWDCCVCLPYCMDSMKDALHYCPNCKTYLGKYCPA